MSNSGKPNDGRNASWTAGSHVSTTVATPPGFVSPTSALWSDTGSADNDVSGDHPRQERRRNERTSSYNNIATVLGNGLAESMDDATREDHVSRSHHDRNQNNATGTPANLTDNFFNQDKNKDMTYERQKRHAASRLIGVSGPSATSSNPNDDSRHSGTLNSSPIGSSPFPQESTIAPFHPSSKSPLSFNGNPNGTPDESQFNDPGKSRLPVTKDIGLTVAEPSDFSYGTGASASNISSAHNFATYGLKNQNTKSDIDISYGIQSDMKNLWSDNGGRAGSMNSNSSPSVQNIGQAIDAEGDLRPFTWDINQHETSRTLAIFNAAAIPCNQIEDLCENFGAIENFRSEFWKRVGVIFITYFDMRSVQFAAMQLPRRLQSLQGGAGNVQVKYCIPLNSSSQNDESLVVINDLPNHIGQNSLGSFLSQFGAIRSLNIQPGSYGSFVAEFNDVQDARKVVYELETRQPWGPDVSIEVGSRKPADRKKGRELLALLGRWRNQGGGAGNGGSTGPTGRGRQVSTPDSYRPHVDSRGINHRDARYDRPMPHDSQLGYGQGNQDGRYSYGGNTYIVHQQQHSGYSQYRGSHHPNDMHGKHGHHGTYVTRSVNHQPPPHQQQFYQQPQHMSHGNFPGGGSVISAASSRHTGASGYYTPDDRSIGSHTSHGSNMRSINSLVDSMAGGSRDTQGQNLILDLELVENDLDKRSSLMVRNIPNKYTQQMLLNEFTENGHGPGVIDFFYLPIDFKNRCNRGYAFINFVDYRDIVKFHRQYYGQHWRTFNSDKICDITYARIQTKASMLKRFENSALMEKDEEYKPLVFVSDGPDKGKRLPFPVSSRGM